MAPPPLRMGQWRFGPDYRGANRAARTRGILAWSPFSNVIDNPFGIFASDFDGNLGEALPKLFVTSNPPFSADDQGNTFPSGTLWAAAWGTGTILAAQMPGTVTPETHGVGVLSTSTRKQWLLYRAQGIKDSADATIQLKKHTSGDVVATIDVFGVDGANQTILFPEFDGFEDDTLDCVADWGASTGDIPPFQVIASHPAANLEYWAIPSTLPTGYTARIAGSHHYQASSDRPLIGDGIPRPGPYRTVEDVAMNVPGLGPETFSFLWIDGVPWEYDWLPEAINQNSFLVLAQATNDIHIDFPPPDGSDIPGVITNGSGTTHGLRSWSLFIQSQDFDGTPISTGGAGYRVVVTRTDTGAALVDQTYTAAELLAGQTVTGSTVTNASLGSDVTITVTLTRSGSPHTSGTVFAWFRGAFRCDIPLPYSITGADQVVGGGYLSDNLTAPSYASSNTLERLSAGTTSYTPPQAGKPVAFIVGSNGWHRVTQDSADLAGVGEFEFGYTGSQKADRGHAGRSFYARALSTTAMALATYSPSFGAIASGGTTLALTTEGVWAFGTISLPAAGTYQISILPTDIAGVQAGLVFEWSKTDATCLATDGVRYFKSQYLLISNTDARWAGSLSDPPAGIPGPGVRDAWIVDSDPTGDWVGHENDVAVWDETLGGWRFYTPKAGAYMQNTALDDWTWFDGTAWKASSDPVITLRVTVDAATAVACTLRWYTNERSPSTPHFKVSWAAA